VWLVDRVPPNRNFRGWDSQCGCPLKSSCVLSGADRPYIQEARMARLSSLLGRICIRRSAESSLRRRIDIVSNE
jgi:hypothetical protein